ncbi:sigma-70 family RNA polymerase sigma factor [Falsibacillus pallidus]|uniref:DNA-directed RNA polymerase n=1 Tax=Falsibacillus pallidus TaxID=493781 RepID=A0A370FY68_9BACI|nr:sigma-70 family RNA polymerase sigma factor [Falsibacillus pallidus]RDI36482.1 DNA-directed RNA polymerase [Falsibacillus pallidus]
MEHFEELHQQYAPMIHKIMNTLHIYMNIDEFYQTGLIALWKAWQDFDHTKGSFTAYAYTSIKGSMMNELTAATKQTETLVYPEEEYWNYIENEHQALNVALNDREALLSYCTNLTPNQTKWVLSTFLEGLSVSEIAEKEKVSPSTVKKWRAMAKEKLMNDSLLL